MAKTKGPLHSIDASGTLGKNISFSKFKGIPRAFKKAHPRNPQTDDQQLQRSYLTEAILAWRDLDDASKQYWQQQVDAKKLQMSGYNYFLSDYIYSRITPPPPPEPIMDQLLYWWKFNENSGSQAYDEIENQLMTLSNCTWDTGHEGHSAVYNGSTSEGEALSVTIPATDQLTWEFWIRPVDAGDNGSGFAARNNYWQFAGYVTRPNIRWDVYCSGTGYDRLDWNHSEADFYNNWHHLVFRWHRLTTQDIYYDNVQKANRTPTKDNQPMAIVTLRTGREYANFFAGRIDTIRIYNKALSEEEIAHNFNL